MKTTFLLLLFIFIFCVSCAQRIKVPINRFISPEAIGTGLQVEYQETGVSVGKLDFSDNSSSNALGMLKTSDRAAYLGGGISQSVDLFVKVHKESSSLLGIKVQVMGEPYKAAASGNKLAFTLAKGSERDTFEESFEIELKSDVTDYSIVHGYRFNSLVLLYDGISLSNYEFEGTISGATGLDSNDISYRAHNIIGVHVGILLGSPTLNFKAEFASQKIEWTNTDSKLFHNIGIAVASGW